VPKDRAIADAAGTYAPNWYTATHVPLAERHALADDLDVDVCVIGAGLVGLTIAYELARAGWSVAVLEAGRVGWGASGRSMSLVTPGFRTATKGLVARVGRDDAKTLWALSAAGVERVRETVSANAMPGVDLAAGQLVVGGDAEADAVVLREQFAAEVEVWPAARVQAAVAGRNYGAALHVPRAFHVHPLNYALGLADAIERAGGRIFEQTRALSLDGEGVRKHIHTAGGRVRAAQIVLAPGGDGGALHPLLDGTVMTLVRPMAITAPLGERLTEVIRFRGFVEHRDAPAIRYHTVGDRLLWQGPLTAWSTRFGTATALRRQISRLHPQLGAPALAQNWLAPVACTVHGMPQIGQFAPGFWLAAAFADHGINVAAMVGDMIARAVREGDDRWRLFKPYGLVWAGGRAGRVVVAMALKGLPVAAWLKRHVGRRQRSEAPAAVVPAVVAQPIVQLPLAERPAAAAAIAAPPSVAEAVEQSTPAAPLPLVATAEPDAATEVIAPIELPAEVQAESQGEAEIARIEMPPVEPLPLVVAAAGHEIVVPIEPAANVQAGPQGEAEAAPIEMPPVAPTVPDPVQEPASPRKKRQSRKAKPAKSTTGTTGGKVAKTRKPATRAKTKSPAEAVAAKKVQRRRKPPRRSADGEDRPTPVPPSVAGAPSTEREPG
jgi:glycine/D-amino acid oxidase-like deaminating enzyme